MTGSFKEKENKTLTIVIFAVLYAALFLPYLFSIPYALPGSDDFSLAAGIDASHRISSSLSLTNHLYMKMGGGIWIAKFFELLLNPIVGRSVTTPATGITLLFYFLLFALSLQFFFRMLFRYGFKVKSPLFREILILLSSALLLTGTVYPEAFYWFSGATYEIFMALLFLYGGLLLAFSGTGKKAYFAGALVTGIICCMNIPYTVPVILSYLYVMLFRDTSCLETDPADEGAGKVRVFRKEIIIPVLLFICASLIYLLSPGVRARSVEVGSSGLSIGSLLDAFVNDLKITVIRGGMIILHCPVQVLLAAALFFAGVLNADKESSFGLKRWMILLVTAVLIVCGAVFPVVLGYGTYEVPNRIGFVIDMLLLVSGVLLLYPLGICLKGIFEKKKILLISTTTVIILSAVFYTFVFVSGKGITSAPLKTLRSFFVIREEHDAWMEILAEAENSAEEDAVITHEAITPTGILNPTGLWEDSSWWVNGALGRFIGKSSVTLKFD